MAEALVKSDFIGKEEPAGVRPFTLLRRPTARTGRVAGLTVAMVGDIAHSRTARSNIWGLKKLGAQGRSLMARPT